MHVTSLVTVNESPLLSGKGGGGFAIVGQQWPLVYRVTTIVTLMTLTGCATCRPTGELIVIPEDVCQLRPDLLAHHCVDGLVLGIKCSLK